MALSLPDTAQRARRESAAHAGKAAFIDKDGTLVENVPYNVDPALLRFTPGALAGLRLLAQAGYRIVVVSNQPGIALGRFDLAALRRLQIALARRLDAEGIALAGFYVCPHAPAEDTEPGCGCRKPAAGLFHRAADTLGLDLAHSWMVGDILDDVEAGHRAGCRSVLLDVGNETVWHDGPGRTPDHVARDLLEAAQLILQAAGQTPRTDAEPDRETATATEADSAHGPRAMTSPPTARDHRR
jgi:D-glycero-D-manno-heptose 1,7-bisphosphate phosphatase